MQAISKCFTFLDCVLFICGVKSRNSSSDSTSSMLDFRLMYRCDYFKPVPD
jgi:hypothetical protein